MAGILTVEDAVVSILQPIAALANATPRYTGTATAGAATTLTDSGATWPVNMLVAGTIAVTAGVGAGQSRVIASNTATVITTTVAWTTQPDATSAYSITLPNVRAYTLKFASADKFPLARVRDTNLSESRRGFGATFGAGKKWVTHRVEIHLDDFAADEVVRYRAFAALIDAVRAQMRTNQTLGQASGILRFGEDVEVQIQEPSVTDGDDIVHFSAIVTSECLEEIDG